MDELWDAIIVGAGFAGAATAYHLSRLGNYRLLILEAEPAVGRHASGKNAALLRQAVENLEVAAWVQETRRVLETPPPDWPRKKIYRKTGSLLAGERPVLQGFADVLKKNDAGFEWIDAQNFPKNFPPLIRDFLDRAAGRPLLFTPDDGVVDIRGLLANYLDAAGARGSHLLCGQEVSELSRQSGRWQLTAGGRRYWSRAVINAAGPWAEGLGLSAGFGKKGLAPMRRHLFLGENNVGLGPDSPYFWDMETECYFRSDPHGLLLCAGDEEPYPARDPEVDPRMESQLRKKLTALFPAFPPLQLRESWACLRTFWQKGPGLVVEEEGGAGFFWVAGLAGHGMGSSFGVGRRAAQLAAAFLDRQNP